MDKGTVIPPTPPMLTVCVRAYLEEIAGSWRMIGGMRELESLGSEHRQTQTGVIWLAMMLYGVYMNEKQSQSHIFPLKVPGLASNVIVS